MRLRLFAVSALLGGMNICSGLASDKVLVGADGSFKSEVSRRKDTRSGLSPDDLPFVLEDSSASLGNPRPLPDTARAARAFVDSPFMLDDGTAPKAGSLHYTARSDSSELEVSDSDGFTRRATMPIAAAELQEQQVQKQAAAVNDSPFVLEAESQASSTGAAQQAAPQRAPVSRGDTPFVVDRPGGSKQAMERESADADDDAEDRAEGKGVQAVQMMRKEKVEANSEDDDREDLAERSGVRVVRNGEAIGQRGANYVSTTRFVKHGPISESDSHATGEHDLFEMSTQALLELSSSSRPSFPNGASLFQPILGASLVDPQTAAYVPVATDTQAGVADTASGVTAKMAETVARDVPVSVHHGHDSQEVLPLEEGINGTSGTSASSNTSSAIGAAADTLGLNYTNSTKGRALAVTTKGAVISVFMGLAVTLFFLSMVLFVLHAGRKFPNDDLEKEVDDPPRPTPTRNYRQLLRAQQTEAGQASSASAPTQP